MGTATFATTTEKNPRGNTVSNITFSDTPNQNILCLLVKMNPIYHKNVITNFVTQNKLNL